jgi:hypothetical protein
MQRSRPDPENVLRIIGTREVVPYQLKRYTSCGRFKLYPQHCIDGEEQSSKMSRYIKSKEIKIPCPRGILRHERQCVIRETLRSLPRCPRVQRSKIRTRKSNKDSTRNKSYDCRCYGTNAATIDVSSQSTISISIETASRGGGRRAARR